MRPGVEIQDHKGHMNVRVGEGVENETSCEMSLKAEGGWARGGVGVGGRRGEDSTSPSEKQQLWTCLVHHRSDCKATDVTVVFTVEVISPGSVCLVRPACSCVTWDGIVSFPAQFRRQRQAHGLM